MSFLGRQGICLLMLIMIAGGHSGCRAIRPPHPLDGHTRFTCCNLRYNRGRVLENGDEQGTILPVGTRVRIDQVLKNRVVFTPEDTGVSLMLIFKGKPTSMSFDRYVDRIFVPDDPSPRVRSLPPKVASVVRRGGVEVGMTRDEVLLSLGYPPVMLTPTLDAPNWRYRKRRGELSAYFDESGRVVKIEEN